MNRTAKRFADYQKNLEQCAQGHLLAFWDELDDTQRALLLDDLDQIRVGAINVAGSNRPTLEFVVDKTELQTVTPGEVTVGHRTGFIGRKVEVVERSPDFLVFRTRHVHIDTVVRQEPALSHGWCTAERFNVTRGEELKVGGDRRR